MDDESGESMEPMEEVDLMVNRCQRPDMNYISANSGVNSSIRFAIGA